MFSAVCPGKHGNRIWEEGGFVLRGVNKRIVEITDTQSEYFERIYFIVREGAGAGDFKRMQREALKYAQKHKGRIPSLKTEEETRSPVTVKVDSRVKRMALHILKYLSVACAGGAVLFAVQALF